jgi:ribosome biogenesis GTPase A
MTISWYPGHMFKANKEMTKIIREIDVIIEILDARMPAASANPLLRRMRGEKPCLQILNKADMAQPEVTRVWLQYLNAQPHTRAIANGTDLRLPGDAIVNQCELLLGPGNHAPVEQGRSVRQVKKQAMIVGIPNVGKSTLMNQIAGRKIARTGNEPAITKGQQRIRLSDDWYLLDTPGVLWPKLADQQAAYRLACAGAIRNTAMDFGDVALFAAEFMLRDFPDRLRERYGLRQLPATAEALMEQLAVSKAYTKGGHVDWHRISELLLNDFRSGKLGRMSLEKPDDLPAELSGEATRLNVGSDESDSATDSSKSANMNPRETDNAPDEHQS